MPAFKQWLTHNRWLVLTGGAIVLGCWWAIGYASSFSMVTIRYNQALGKVTLHQADNSEVKFNNNTPLRLKKGQYSLKITGPKAQPERRTVTIHNDTQVVTVAINYSRAHLDNLLTREQAAIHQVIYQHYPKLANLYSLEREQLYGLANIYGARLDYYDQTSDQRDSLRLLLTKRHDKWQLRSQPPQPLLSAPLFPDVDKNIITAINRSN